MGQFIYLFIIQVWKAEYRKQALYTGQSHTHLEKAGKAVRGEKEGNTTNL